MNVPANNKCVNIELKCCWHVWEAWQQTLTLATANANKVTATCHGKCSFNYFFLCFTAASL